jgi:radical SAM protein with 4Fe4S-binding SPASM domain
MVGKHTYADAPARVYWEITRACSLACLHCRAEAAPHAAPGQLSTAAGLALLRKLAAVEPKPHVVLTGGDPLEREDLFQLIAEGRALGLNLSLSPSATPLLTERAIDELVAAGISAISLSLDGATAAHHDAIRGVPGCFERTLAAGRRAAAAGLAFQINTLVSAETIDDMPAIDALVRELGASRWSLFFLVSVGRGTVLTPISAAQTEALLVWFAERAKLPGPVLTTTEAPHFRRVALQHRDATARPTQGHGAGIRDGNGVMFISHDGDVTPSGFLPIVAGNVKLEDPIRIYREGVLFRELRAVDRFHGRCGHCEYRAVCGGSRARAFVASGDPLGEDPLCVYQPKAERVTGPSAATS